jgi:hypothetical protein
MGRVIIICTDWYTISVNFLCGQKKNSTYVETHSMKWKRMDKLEEIQVVKAKRVDHVYIVK